jgi:hypothetical protein
MTYTFKLARRLAVSRASSSLPLLLALAACSGTDATAPQGSPTELPESGIYGWRPRESTPVVVQVNPSRVTVETNQLIQFEARGQNRAGDNVVAPISWSATGGTILPDGRFSAAAVGTYQVIGRTRIREDLSVVDTSTVTVVRRQLGLVRIEVTPDTVTLTPGISHQFTAIGRVRSGTPKTIGVAWSATGGKVDPAGHYLAGDTAGSYVVVATNLAGTLSDTARVTIAAPPAPPPPADTAAAPAPPTIPLGPPPAPAPPPTDTAPGPAPAPPPPDTAPTPAPPPVPTLTTVTLLPATATLAPGATRQFTATSAWSDGSTTPVTSFVARGGTISATGLYTAGTTAGTYRVMASSGTLTDTSFVTITAPLGSGSAMGIAYGAFGLVLAGVFPSSFNLSLDGYQPYNIIDRINAARTGGRHLVLAMTGGGHSNYMTNGIFDRSKWDAKMELFNTSAIRNAVAGGVADGTIIAASVMDEPQADGSGENTWGPRGTMTKARVDSLCGYVKAIFPTLPTGVVHRHDVFEPTKSYRVCDFIASQYSARAGSVTAFRDGGLAMAQRDGHAIMFSMNILNGGIQDKDGTWDCGGATLGQDPPNCQITAAQLRDFGSVLGPAGCGLLMWRYDQTYMSRSDNKQAFADVAALLASQPAKQCRRK